MSRAKKVSELSFEFNEAQGRGNIIASAIENDMVNGTNPEYYEKGDTNTRYEVTITVRELGDWDKT